MRQIVLASESPRRKEILELLGLEFVVIPSTFDEKSIKTDDPEEMVEELALQKAYKVAKNCSDAIIIGGDTLVVLGEEMLGKVETKEGAREMLRKLLGKTHRVVTGVAVIDTLTGESRAGSEVGIVKFRNEREGELEQYVENERNWRGFAGSYALQGGAAPFVMEQTGKLSAIIGMPVELTSELLEQMGVQIEVDPREVEESLRGKRVGIGEEYEA